MKGAANLMDIPQSILELFKHHCPNCGKDDWETLRDGRCGGSGEVKGCTWCESCYIFLPKMLAGGLMVDEGPDRWEKCGFSLTQAKLGISSLMDGLYKLKSLGMPSPSCMTNQTGCKGEGLVTHTLRSGKKRTSPCIICFPDDPWAKEIKRQIEEDLSSPRAT